MSRVAKPAAEAQLLHLQIVRPKGNPSYFASTPPPSVSPDGRFVTYKASVNGKTGIWLHPLDGSPDRLLVDNADDVNAREPFWSPDGRSVGWFAGGQLWRTDLSGGRPVALCRGDVPGDPPVWTADGRILFGSPSGLMQIADSGGTPTQLTKVDAWLGETGHTSPQLLPGGRLLYFAASTKAEDNAIYAAPLSDPSKRVPVTHSIEPFHYAPGGDGKEYLWTVTEQAVVARAFNSRKLTLGPPRTVVSQVRSQPVPLVAVSPTGLLLYAGGPKGGRFSRVDRAGKTIDVLSEPDSYNSFRLSLDGKRFIATRAEGGPANSLWVMAVERRVFSLFTPKSFAPNELAVWSNHGQTVLFNKGAVVFRKDITASGEGERVADWAVRRLSDWSRDGRYLLYEVFDTETKRDLWVAPVTPDGRLADGAQPKPYLRGPSAEWHGRFSPEPNPRWVAYQSDETGRDEIYIASFPDPKRRLQVTSRGGTFPQWGADGREVFYISSDGMLTVVGLKNVAGGSSHLRPSSCFPWLPVRKLASPYEVSPDGKRILVNLEEPWDLNVVVNWPLLLRRQADQ